MSTAKVKDLSEETVALFTAVRGGKEGHVRQSLKAGADVNAFKCGANFTNKFEKRLLYFSGHKSLGTYKNSPLMLAVYKGNVRIVKILLNSGANVNSSNGWGITPLMKAATNPKCSVKLTKLLIRKGADATSTNRLGQSALHFAVCSDGEECLKALIAAGADVNQGDNRSKTPLMEACAIGSKNCASVLIQQGADVNTADNKDMTALLHSVTDQTDWYFAHHNGYNCISLLLKAGACLKFDHEGRNISKRHLLKRKLSVSFFGLSDWNERVLELLFAAGDTTDGTSIDAETPPFFGMYRSGRLATIAIPEFLQKLNRPEFCLMDMCRRTIRKHLLQMGPINLCYRIPRLGFPPLLTRYLLYGITLDEDDDEDNDADDNYNIVPRITRYGRTSRRPNRFKSNS